LDCCSSTVDHPVIAVTALLSVIAVMSIASVSTTVVLTTAVVSPAVVAAQEVFEKAHGVRPSSIGDINTSKR
jgi:hypothetical protein|tara:strand:+ start:2004 stop:2219 length:216 start_codon:yes stop_codon:yes gene_type:complete